VSPVRILSVQTAGAHLQWDAPWSSLPVVTYQVRYSSIHGTVTNTTNGTTFVLNKLSPATSYTVQVGSQTDSMHRAVAESIYKESVRCWKDIKCFTLFFDVFAK